MRFQYRPGHLVSRLYHPQPPPLRPQDDLTLQCGRARQDGWRKRVDRGSKRGPPKGGLARRMGRYVCCERTTDRPPSWNRCRSSGRKELLRSSGAAEVCTLHRDVYVRAFTYTPFSLSSARVPSHAGAAVDPPSGCARMHGSIEKT